MYFWLFPHVPVVIDPAPLERRDSTSRCWWVERAGMSLHRPSPLLMALESLFCLPGWSSSRSHICPRVSDDPHFYPPVACLLPTGQPVLRVLSLSLLRGSGNLFCIYFITSPTVLVCQGCQNKVSQAARLKNRSVFFHNSGGWKSESQVWWVVSSEALLLGL